MTGIKLAPRILARELQTLRHKHAVVAGRPGEDVCVEGAQRHVTEILVCVALGVVVVLEQPRICCKVVLHAVTSSEIVRVEPARVRLAVQQLASVGDLLLDPIAACLEFVACRRVLREELCLGEVLARPAIADGSADDFGVLEPVRAEGADLNEADLDVLWPLGSATWSAKVGSEIAARWHSRWWLVVEPGWRRRTLRQRKRQVRWEGRSRGSWRRCRQLHRLCYRC